MLPAVLPFMAKKRANRSDGIVVRTDANAWSDRLHCDGGRLQFRSGSKAQSEKVDDQTW